MVRRLKAKSTFNAAYRIGGRTRKRKTNKKIKTLKKK